MRLHGVERYPIEVASVYPKGRSVLYRHVGLWQDGCPVTSVVASPQESRNKVAVITNEPPVCRQCGNVGFRVEVIPR